MTIGSELDRQLTELRQTLAHTQARLAELTSRVRRLEHPDPPPQPVDDVPWIGEKFVEIDSSKINNQWPVQDQSHIPYWDAKLRLPPNHIAPYRLNKGIEWRHNPSGSFNHSQLRIQMTEKDGRFMSTSVPWCMQPDRTYGFTFNFNYSSWPTAWVNMFQLYGWISPTKQKDVVALFHKNGGLVFHYYDDHLQSHQSEPFKVAAGETHHVAMQVRAGTQPLLRCWIKTNLWKLQLHWSGPIGSGQLLDEPDALFDVRFGPYSNSPIEKVVYDRIQYWLVDE